MVTFTGGVIPDQQDPLIGQQVVSLSTGKGVSTDEYTPVIANRFNSNRRFGGGKIKPLIARGN